MTVFVIVAVPGVLAAVALAGTLLLSSVPKTALCMTQAFAGCAAAALGL